jgi:hypothetical protein
MIPSEVKVHGHTGDPGNSDIDTAVSGSEVVRMLPVDKSKGVKKTNPWQKMPVNLAHQATLALGGIFRDTLVYHSVGRSFVRHGACSK